MITFLNISHLRKPHQPVYARVAFVTIGSDAVFSGRGWRLGMYSCDNFRYPWLGRCSRDNFRYPWLGRCSCGNFRYPWRGSCSCDNFRYPWRGSCSCDNFRYPWRGRCSCDNLRYPWLGRNDRDICAAVELFLWSAADAPPAINVLSPAVSCGNDTIV